jgi:hypothetical protein
MYSIALLVLQHMVKFLKRAGGATRNIRLYEHSIV